MARRLTSVLATLTVERHEAGLRYRLDVPEHDVVEPLQAEVIHPVDGDTLVALQRTAESLLRRPEGPAFPDDARTAGRMLYNTLVPLALREPLARLSGSLLVSTSLYGLPWELLHDGGEFWAVRYALGKRLVMSRALIAGTRGELRGRPRSLIVGSDPRGDLPFVAHEVERIAAALERSTDITCVSGPAATFDGVSAYLAQGYDLIHFCGHVATERSGGPGLLLADDRLLTPPVIEASLVGRPLVFLNGCASVRGRDDDAAAPWEERVLGVSHAFLFAGATATIGTLCAVTDRHAASLAEDFYRLVLEPQPIGDSLRQARARCRSDPATALSPTWLSFALYGNPAQVLFRPAMEPPAPRVVERPVQRPAAPARSFPRPRALAVGLVVLLAVVLGLLYRTHSSTTAPAKPLVVGVMEVHARGGNVPDWMPDVTRDGLNTIFSKLSALQVYSRQKIDFIREKQRLSEIEAAESLHMTKMIAGTLSVAENTTTLEVQIVDISTGLLEASERAVGPTDSLIALQNEVAVKALKSLGVKPSDEELKAILAIRTNETLDAYKLVNETLGGEPAPKVPAEKETPPGPSSRRWTAVAFAQEMGTEEQAIHAVLEQYRSGLQQKDIELLTRIQADMTAHQRSALLQYFQNAKNLIVRLSDIDIQIAGDEALATFTREDVFTDAPTGRPLHIVIRISSVLGRDGAGWRIRTLKKPS